MFVQVISARVKDRDGLRREFERWDRELRPGADGFLGSTGGISDDGEMVVLARFESEEQARRNSDRSEQGDWWQAVSKTLDGEATFREATDVDLMGRGGSDDAGFVQVMQGTVKDIARARALAPRLQELTKDRPDILGGIALWHAGGTFTQAVYFTSEAEARAGERKELSPAAQKLAEEMDAVATVERYIDLREPWLR